MLRTRRLRSADEGFTLVESIVALLIAAIVFMAVTGALLTALKSSSFSRQTQQAADFMTRSVEQAREMSFASLGHVASDVTTAVDPRITNCAGSPCVDPGTGTAEKLHVLASGAGISQHIATPTSTEANKTRFSVATYVTEVAGQDPAQLLRVSSRVTWSSQGRQHVRSTSTLVTYAQRGLPLPRFTIVNDSATPVTKAPSATHVFAVKLANQGAPDRWNLSLSGVGATLPWALYQDNNGNQTYDAVTDTVITDSNADGTVDTGRLDPNGFFEILMVWNVPAGQADGTYTTEITATSVAQPTASGASAFATVTPVVAAAGAGGSTTGGTTGSTTGSTTGTTTGTTTGGSTGSTTGGGSVDCAAGTALSATQPTGYTMVQNGLHNGNSGTVGDTTTQTLNAMNGTLAYATSLSKYSTEQSPNVAGRRLDTTATSSDAAVLSLTGATQYAGWRRQMPAKTDVAGTAVLHLWVGSPTGSLSGFNLKVVAFTTNAAGNALTSIGSATVSSGSTCGGFQEVYVQIPLTATTISKNGSLGVRVVNSGSSALQLAYDVNPTYVGYFTASQK